jgi:hypothetical protein
MEVPIKLILLSGIGAMAISGVLPATLALAGLTGHAQSNGTATPDHASSHHHYQLIDLGTLGGPNSSFPGSIESINPSGTVMGVADTSFLDPNFAIQHPFFGDPYIERSYVWKDGRRSALPVLRGGSNADTQWINGNGSIAGF